MNKSKQHINKGFTLVELLIAISLIAILSGVLFSVLNPIGIQKQTRDSQRVSDLAKIKVALESYFADNRAYPIPLGSTTGFVSANLLKTTLEAGHINVFPTDPKQTGTVCTNTAWRGYSYKTDALGAKYFLTTNMETNTMGGSCPYTVGSVDANTWCTCINQSTTGTMYLTTAD